MVHNKGTTCPDGVQTISVMGERKAMSSSSSFNVFPARFIAHIAANRPWCKTCKTPPRDQ
jgi:hypothetical protein